MTTNNTTNAKKETVKMPMIFNEAELDARKDSAKHEYLNGVYKYYEHSQTGSYSYPATIVQTFGYLEQMVDFLVEAAANGQQRFTGESIHAQPGFFSVRIYKPVDQITRELESLYQKVEADYKAEIEAHNEQQKQLLIQQLVEAEEAKERKKEEEKKAKILAAAEKDAESYFQSILNKSK